MVDRLAERGDPARFAFTEPRIKDPDGVLDYSFSGLKTAVIRIAIGLTSLPLPDPERPPQPVLDLLASFQRTIVEWLLAPLEELAARHGPKVIAASGGVAGNRELRQAPYRLGGAPGARGPAAAGGADHRQRGDDRPCRTAARGPWRAG